MFRQHIPARFKWKCSWKYVVAAFLVAFSFVHYSLHRKLAKNALNPKPVERYRYTDQQKKAFPVLHKKIRSSSNKNADWDTFKKREKIKKMMQHAWHNYAKHAWGANELGITKKYTQRRSLGPFPVHLGATIVDAIDTLFVMGLREEFHQAREWIAANFSFSRETLQESSISVFESNIRLVGGLLSAYAFTGDKMFKDKAKTTADALLPAFKTETGLPLPEVIFPKGNNSWDYDECVKLSEAGSFHLEFAYLSAVTRDQTYLNTVQNVRTAIKATMLPDGTLSNDLSTSATRDCHENGITISFANGGDSFYEYLVKSYLLTGDPQAKYLAEKIMPRTLDKTVVKSYGKKFMLYVTKNSDGYRSHIMNHLACFTGGLLALFSRMLAPQPESETYLKMAKAVTATCHLAYGTATGLAPQHFSFGYEEVEPVSFAYKLYPETVESYFYLWRLTGQQKYRDWAWQVVLALEKNCRISWGYSGLANVQSKQSYNLEQPSYFLAETLKYLYLTFADDLLPLDQWVFNTEGHPLPVKGRNPAWPD